MCRHWLLSGLVASICLGLSTYKPYPSKALLEAQRSVACGSLCYNKAVRLSRKCRSVDERLQVFRLAAPVLGAAEHLASFALDGLASAGEYGRCKILLEDFIAQYNLKPTAVSYSILLKALTIKRLKNHTSASSSLLIEQDILNEMQSRGIIPDAIFVNALVDTYVRLDSLDKAAAIIALIFRDREPINHLEMQIAQLEPNIASINALLRGLAKKGDVITAFRIHRRLAHFGLKPTPRTHAALATALAAIGKPHLALARLRSEIVKDSSLLKDEAWTAAYTALIRSWPNIQDSWKCLKEMCKYNIKRNSYTYAELLVACRLRINRDPLAREMEVTRAWNTMRDDGITPSVICYNAAISAYLAGENDFKPTQNAVTRALRLVTELGQQRERIPVSTLNALVDGLSTTYPELALRLMPQVEGINSPLAARFEPADIRTWTLALKIHRYNLNKLRDTWNQLEMHTSISIDTIALNTYLDALIKGEDFDSAVQVLEQYGSIGISDRVSYTTVISGFTKNPITALRLYDTFRGHSTPDLGLVHAALTACAALRSSSDSTDSSAARAATRILKDAQTVLSPHDFARARDFARSTLVSTSPYLKANTRRASQDKDPLFQKKRWNSFDSGFRIL